MGPTLFLVNDDEPGQFAPRSLTVVRDDLRVGDQPGIVVAIDPPIQDAVGGSLAAALLVPRHRDVRIGDIRRGKLERPASVFVCRFEGDPGELSPELTKADVSIVFWGLVNDSPEFKP